MNDNQTSSVILPEHSNKMALSIICTIFCCLIGGIIAIVYSSKSNSLYNSAIYAADDSVKQTLFYESEQKNKIAQTWITVSIIFGFIYILAFAFFHAASGFYSGFGY
ncbi:MAG: CD225/dispanin family protein [Bacteroidales bacterium]|jgi:hypothetical protein|nr:CD225/dispanin family protein [Bacteroidales bacterium]